MNHHVKCQISIALLLFFLLLGVCVSMVLQDPLVARKFYPYLYTTPNKRSVKGNDDDEECLECSGLSMYNARLVDLPDGSTLFDNGKTKIFITKPDTTRAVIDDNAPRVVFFYKSSGCAPCFMMKPSWEAFVETTGKGLIACDAINTNNYANIRDQFVSKTFSVPLVVFKKNKADPGVKLDNQKRSTQDITDFVFEQMIANNLLDVSGSLEAKQICTEAS
jgi:thiol-disulfide isomerase/thioredoxin